MSEVVVTIYMDRLWQGTLWAPGWLGGVARYTKQCSAFLGLIAIARWAIALVSGNSVLGSEPKYVLSRTYLDRVVFPLWVILLLAVGVF